MTETHLSTQQSYYEKNRVNIRKQQKQHYDENKDEITRKKREKRKNNKQPSTRILLDTPEAIRYRKFHQDHKEERNKKNSARYHKNKYPLLPSFN